MVTCLLIGFLYHLLSALHAINRHFLYCSKQTQMDFFETQERYRKREMRGWLLLLFRTSVVAGVLWLGWLWGHAEQTSLQAEADLVIYENNLRITALSAEVQSLQRLLAEAEAHRKTVELAEGNNAELQRIVTKQIARGVEPEQILQSVQRLGKPSNCREVDRQNIAVATPLYAGPESKLSLFEGGSICISRVRLAKKAARESPWFDPSLPIKVRQVFLNGQKISSGMLPLEAVIPAEQWLLKLRFEKSDLRGYVRVIVSSCTLR